MEYGVDAAMWSVITRHAEVETKIARRREAMRTTKKGTRQQARPAQARLALAQSRGYSAEYT